MWKRNKTAIEGKSPGQVPKTAPDTAINRHFIRYMWYNKKVKTIFNRTPLTWKGIPYILKSGF